MNRSVTEDEVQDIVDRLLKSGIIEDSRILKVD
jgi:hypothetical protein